MEKQIIELPMLRVGLKVKIKQNSRFYVGGPRDGNPKDVEGHITDSTGPWVSVKWLNGRSNNYEGIDLDILEEVERLTTNKNCIYFHEGIAPPTTIQELLGILFDNGTAETYYKTEEEGKMVIQCHAGKMRSFDDIVYLCNSYLPDLPVKDMFEASLLYKVEYKDVKSNMIRKSLSNCSTMGRVRITTSCNTFSSLWNSAQCTKYNSIYSWSELFSMLDIKSAQGLQKWYADKLAPETTKSEESDKVVC